MHVSAALGSCKCAQPKDTGSCQDATSAPSEKYFYNTEADKCDKFQYSGCGGNGNNFQTKIECQAECAGMI